MPDSNFTNAVPDAATATQTYTQGDNNAVVHSTTISASDCFIPFLGLRSKIAQFGKEFNLKNVEQPQLFSSIDDMLKKVKEFFSSIDTSLGEKMNEVMNNYMIRKNITIAKEGNSTMKMQKEGDAIVMTGSITPDAKGLVALSQGIADAYVYDRYNQQEKKESAEMIEKIKDTTSKFFALLTVNYIAQDSRLNPRQIEELQYDVLRGMSPNIMAQEQDEKILDQILENNPDTFVNCQSSEDFIEAFTDIVNNPSSGIPSQEITERMKTISEDNPTLYINTADGMDTMVSYISAGMFEKNGKNPEIVANIVKGVYCADKLLDKGMTPEQIAKLTEAEIDTMIEQDKANEQHHEQEQELEEELVLEMVKKPNNN